MNDRSTRPQYERLIYKRFETAPHRHTSHDLGNHHRPASRSVPLGTLADSTLTGSPALKSRRDSHWGQGGGLVAAPDTRPCARTGAHAPSERHSAGISASARVSGCSGGTYSSAKPSASTREAQGRTRRGPTPLGAGLCAPCCHLVARCMKLRAMWSLGSGTLFHALWSGIAEARKVHARGNAWR